MLCALSIVSSFNGAAFSPMGDLNKKYRKKCCPRPVTSKSVHRNGFYLKFLRKTHLKGFSCKKFVRAVCILELSTRGAFIVITLHRG